MASKGNLWESDFVTDSSLATNGTSMTKAMIAKNLKTYSAHSVQFGESHPYPAQGHSLHGGMEISIALYKTAAELQEALQYYSPLS